MKCTAGSLALITNHRFSGNIGSFVTLKKVALVHGELGAFWSFEKASKPLMFGVDDFSFVVAFETTAENGALLRDADLHPLPIKHDRLRLQSSL